MMGRRLRILAFTSAMLVWYTDFRCLMNRVQEGGTLAWKHDLTDGFSADGDYYLE